MSKTWNIIFNLHRDGARVNASAVQYNGLATGTNAYTNDNSNSPEMVTFSTIDSVGSVSGTPISYGLVASSNSSVTQWINRCFASPAAANQTGISEIVITEIGA